MASFWLKSCSLLLAAVIATPVVVSAQIAEGFAEGIAEGFEDVPGLVDKGWVFVDNSRPPGILGWFQGLTEAEFFFDARTGSPNAYAASSFSSVDIGDQAATTFTLSNWLLTPTVDLFNGATLAFYTRTVSSPAFLPDRLEVRLSTSGASTDVGSDAQSVGDFNFTGGPLRVINIGLSLTGYPGVWTRYAVVLSGLSEPARGRFGFRHFVTDVERNGDYIGIDDVSYNAAPMQVPEPSSVALLLVGLVGLSSAARRRRIDG